MAVRRLAVFETNLVAWMLVTLKTNMDVRRNLFDLDSCLVALASSLIPVDFLLIVHLRGYRLTQCLVKLEPIKGAAWVDPF